MARTGMSTLISTMRGLCNLGTNDYTLGTSAYWHDDHIQTVLDRHKMTVVEDELQEVVNTISGGSTEYKIFHSHFGNYEETTGGSSIFTVEDATGALIGTASYSVDYANGIVTFGADQQGSARYLTGYSYDIYSAAAEIYTMKAGAYAEFVNFKTDNMSVDRGSAIKQCLNMAKEYAMKGRATNISFDRDDCT